MESFEIVCNNSLIVERIFVYLELIDLHNCASVSTLWKSIAKKVIGRRDRIFWTLKVHELEASEELDSEVDPMRPVDVGTHLRQILPNAPSEPKMVLMFICDGIRTYNNAFHSYFQMNGSEDDFEYHSSEAGEDFEWLFEDSDNSQDNQNFEDSDNSQDNQNFEDSKNLEASGNLVKCEATSDGNQAPNVAKLFEDQNKPGASQAMSNPFMAILTRDFPQDCKIVTAFVDGFIGTSEDLGLPREILGRPGFTAVFFPMILGVEMFTFTCMKTRAAYTGRQTDYDNRKPYILGLPKDKNIKCILLFVELDMISECILHTIQEDYLKNQDCGIALAGATCYSEVRSFAYYSKEVVQNLGIQVATGVAFAGENVHVASVFVERMYREPGNVFQKLHELKACDFPEENCVAFMFANGSRYTAYKGDEQRTPEITAFHEIFPKVPLFAAFGEWVFWIEHLPKAQNGNEPSSTLILDDFDPMSLGRHSVFVLLCFGEA